MATTTVARSLHDVGLATWFGGSLMGAVGLNRAAGEVDDPRQRARVASVGWARWTPVNLGAIAAHGIGAVVLTRENGKNGNGLRAHDGLERTTAVQAGLAAAALGATVYSRLLGRKVLKAGDVPVESGTQPTNGTPPEVKGAQRQLRVLQWAIPALTGALMVTSRLAEQQRLRRGRTEVVKGRFRRLVPGF
jgi:hypothetical protein